MAGLFLSQKKTRVTRNFFLLEILIGLGLISMILALLFTFLAGQMRLEKRMETARARVLERQNLQTRLQDLFTSLARPTSDPSLYTQSFPKEESASLVISYDNGIDPDPHFSGMLLGRIYLDSEKNLCLAAWPLEEEKNRSWRKETLMKGVSSFSLEFLGEKKDPSPQFKAVTTQTGWHSVWSKERNDLPSIIRLTIEQNGTPLQFAFRLPVSDPVPTYREGGLKP